MNHTNNGQQYLLQETNYEAEVKKVYPMAMAEKATFGFWFIVSSNIELSAPRHTETTAWQSAYANLKKQGKI